MDSLHEQYPQFEKGSHSAQYQQIINFCINYTEGLLINLMHLEVDEDFMHEPESYQKLQEKLQKRERTVRHAFQFKVEKQFAEFRSIRRTRLHSNRSSDWLSLGLAGQNSSMIQQAIESASDDLEQTFQQQLSSLSKRLKTLVHREDDAQDDNPLAPVKLCEAFLASIETLNFTSKQVVQLFELFQHVLTTYLAEFYRQLDLGMYHLDIMPELTDPSIFEVQEPEPEPEQVEEIATDTADFEGEEQPEDLTSALDLILLEFREQTIKGTLDYTNLYAGLKSQLYGLIDEKQYSEISHFLDFYNQLLNNRLLSDPLKLQLSRISQPLILLVKSDPFFFRSSNHPVNDFLQSIIDYDIQYNKDQADPGWLSELLDELLESETPTLDDYLPIIEKYETVKAAEVERQLLEKQKLEQQEKELKDEIMKQINEMTDKLVVEQDILAFFYDDWHLLLQQVGKKLGADSNSFKQSIEIAKMLAWNLNKNREDNPEYSKYSFASLLKAIDKGLVSLNFSASHRTRTRKMLVEAFRNATRKMTGLVIATDRKAPAKKLNDFSETMNNTNLDLAGIAKIQPTGQNAALINFLNSLQIGSWVELKEKGQKPKRGKLKWKASDNSLFIFMDQRGHKIHECNLEELKQSFSEEQVKLLSSPSKASSKPSLGHGYHF